MHHSNYKMRRTKALTDLETLNEENIGSRPSISKSRMNISIKAKSRVSSGWDEDDPDETNLHKPVQQIRTRSQAMLAPLSQLKDSFANIPPDRNVLENQRVHDLLQRNFHLAHELNRLRDDNSALNKEVRRLRQILLSLPQASSKHAEAQTSGSPFSAKAICRKASQSEAILTTPAMRREDIDLDFLRQHSLQYPSPDRVTTELFAATRGGADDSPPPSYSASTDATGLTPKSSTTFATRIPILIASTGGSRESRSRSAGSGTGDTDSTGTSTAIKGSPRRSPTKPDRARLYVTPSDKLVRLASPIGSRFALVGSAMDTALSAPSSPSVSSAYPVQPMFSPLRQEHSQRSPKAQSLIDVPKTNESDLHELLQGERTDMSVSALLDEVESLDPNSDLDRSSRWMDLSISLSDSFVLGNDAIESESSMLAISATDVNMAASTQRTTYDNSYQARVYESEVSPRLSSRSFLNSPLDMLQPKISEDERSFNLSVSSTTPSRTRRITIDSLQALRRLG